MPEDGDPRGVLHRHSDGVVHRHFQEGFIIGGQVIADHDGTEDHTHGTMDLVTGENVKGGPVIWTENDLVCVQCGCDIWIDDNEVSHHWDSGNADIDFDLDRDHTAVPDNGEYGIFATEDTTE